MSFVTSKTRVAPIQLQTIPRLELLSALLLARLLTAAMESLQPVLSLHTPRCFTDSQVVLYWIRGVDKGWKLFVQNRVNEIRKLIPSTQWSHCSGKTNPADLPSRGLTSLELSVSCLWREGPEWLRSDEPNAEEDKEESSMPGECEKELKAGSRIAHNLLASEHPTGIGSVMNCGDFSSMLHLRRVTAYVLRAIRVFKSLKECNSTSSCQTPLTMQDLTEAENLWIAQAQISLTNDKNFELWKKQFGLFLEDRMWRCGGRLSNAGIPYSTKHPLLLPRNHPITNLFVREAHNRVQHNGVKETLTELRARFWIVKGRSLVRYFIHRCVICRRFEGRALQAPPPPPLPPFREKEEPPFSFTGVDFAGPFTFGSQNRQQVARYGYVCSHAV